MTIGDKFNFSTTLWHSKLINALDQFDFENTVNSRLKNKRSSHILSKNGIFPQSNLGISES